MNVPVRFGGLNNRKVIDPITITERIRDHDSHMSSPTACWHGFRNATTQIDHGASCLLALGLTICIVRDSMFLYPGRPRRVEYFRAHGHGVRSHIPTAMQCLNQDCGGEYTGVM